MGFSIGKALGGLGSVFAPTTLLGTIGLSGAEAVANNYFNKKAAKKQLGYTKDLIDYENEYNLPVNQRARLEEAGYNPNLALNGVNVQSATGSAPQVKPTQLDMLQAYNLEAQNELLQSQEKLTNQNAYLAQANTAIADYKKSEAHAKSVMALYNADYAEAEHELWRKTGKIPQSYYKSDWQAELTSLIKGLFN